MWGPLSILSASLSLVFPRGLVLMPWPGLPRCLFALHTKALASLTSPGASEWDTGLSFTVSSNHLTVLPHGGPSPRRPGGARGPQGT